MTRPARMPIRASRRMANRSYSLAKEQKVRSNSGASNRLEAPPKNSKCLRTGTEKPRRRRRRLGFSVPVRRHFEFLGGASKRFDAPEFERTFCSFASEYDRFAIRREARIGILAGRVIGQLAQEFSIVSI